MPEIRPELAPRPASLWKAIVTIGGADLVRVLSGSIVTLAVARRYGAVDLGVLAFVLSSSNIAILVADWGISSAVQSRYGRMRSAISRNIVVRSGLLVRSLATLCIALAIGLSDQLLGIVQGHGWWIAAITAVSALEYPVFVHNARGDPTAAGWLQFRISGSFVLLGLLACILNLGIGGVVAARIVSGGWGILGTLKIIGDASSTRASALTGVKRIFTEGWQTIAASSGTLLLDEGPILALTYLVGGAAVGEFKLAATVARLVAIGGSLLRLPLQGQLAHHLARSDLPAYRRTVKHAGLLTAIGLAALAAVAVVFRRQIVGIFLGAVPEYGFGVLAYLAIAEWCRGVSLPGFQGVYMLGGVRPLLVLGTSFAALGGTAMVAAAGFGGPLLVAQLKVFVYGLHASIVWLMLREALKRIDPWERGSQPQLLRRLRDER
jgi:O-antigen/teichoic acid export membrane protein